MVTLDFTHEKGPAGSHEQNDARRPCHQLKRKITDKQKPGGYCD
jgi:hypothetical protein